MGVTFDVFLPMMQAVTSKPCSDTVDDFVEGLRHFDKAGDGRISAAELRHLLCSLGEKMSEERWSSSSTARRTRKGTSTTRSLSRWCSPSSELLVERGGMPRDGDLP